MLDVVQCFWYVRRHLLHTEIITRQGGLCSRDQSAASVLKTKREFGGDQILSILFLHIIAICIVQLVTVPPAQVEAFLSILHRSTIWLVACLYQNLGSHTRGQGQ